MINIDVHTHVYDYSGRSSALTGDIAITYCVDGRCRTGVNPSFTVPTDGRLRIEAPRTVTVKPLEGSFEVRIPVTFDRIEVTRKYDARAILTSYDNVFEHTLSGFGTGSFDLVIYYRPTDVPTVLDNVGYATASPDLKKRFCDSVRPFIYGGVNAKVYSGGSYIGTFREVCG